MIWVVLVLDVIKCNYFLGIDGNLVRREFLNYVLFLMRFYNDEYVDLFLSLDISFMRYVVYVFDFLIYYMRSGIDIDVDVFRLVLVVCKNFCYWFKKIIYRIIRREYYELVMRKGN